MIQHDAFQPSEVVTYAGGLTACGGAALIGDENTVILIISIVGAILSTVGLLYTIWNGERNYRLRLKELEAGKQEGDEHDT